MFTIATVRHTGSHIVQSIELGAGAFFFRGTPPASWTTEEHRREVSQEEARGTLLAWRDLASEGGLLTVLHEDQLLMESHFGARHLEMLVGEAPDPWLEEALAQANEEYAERMPNADDDAALEALASEIAGRFGLAWAFVEDTAEVRFSAPAPQEWDEEHVPNEEGTLPDAFDPEAQADLELHNALHPDGYGR